MASSTFVKEHEPLKEKDIVCLGHLKRVFTLLDRLQDVGCDRDRAGNRELFFNDYCKLVLLYIWNPLIGSVRMLQEATGLKNVAKALGVKRFSLGSFSEAPRVFEPEQLKPVIEELAGQVRPLSQDPRLDQVKHAITLVDGTVLRGLTRLARSAAGAEGRYNTSRDGKAVYGWRLHKPCRNQRNLQPPSHRPHRGTQLRSNPREQRIAAEPGAGPLLRRRWRIRRPVALRRHR